ncbi:MAG: ABC transporter ATP-binding protein [Dehalococcoidia bacterium]
MSTNTTSIRRPAPGAAAIAAMPFVIADDVFKVYREGDVETVALRGASMSVERGEFVAIVGRSGSGKSTLLNIIGGLAETTAGRVAVAGVDLARADEEVRATVRSKHVGMVFQADNLVPFLTAEENVALPMQLAGRADASARARQLLEELGVGPRRGHRPEQLSGGEKQRVAIATAIANEPELLLGDELTGELDTKNTDAVLDALATLNERGMTLVIVTHNMRVARRATRILHIKDGLIEESEGAHVGQA